MPRLRSMVALAAAWTLLVASPATGDAPPVNGEILFTADGPYVGAIRPDGDLRYLNTDGRDPAWSPSATRFAFSDNLASLWSARADGTDARRLTTVGGNTWDLAPDWSPDGGLIAFTRRDTSSDVWVMGADGGNQRPLATGPLIERQPAWSPDGRTIAFTSNRGGSFAIWRMDADGADARPLAAPSPYNSDPTWSPDGTRIAFAAGDSPGRTDIVTVDTTGGDPRRVTTGGAGDRRPSWSPDGRQIVFARRYALLMAELPTGKPVTLVPRVVVSPQNPDWGPVTPPIDAPQGLESVNADPTGPVAVQVPGAVAPTPLTRAAELPVGTVVDTRSAGSSLEITAAAGAGRTSTAEVSLGRVTYVQTGKRRDPTNELRLRPATSCPSRRAAVSVPAYDRVRVDVKRPGRWSVKGPHSINGSSHTSWVTTVRCTRTITEVHTGLVRVRDLKTGNRVRVAAGRCYVAPSRVRRPRRRCR